MELYTVVLAYPMEGMNGEILTHCISTYGFSPLHAAQRAQINYWMSWIADQDILDSCDPDLDAALPQPRMVSGFLYQPDDFPILAIFPGLQESLY